jgi:Protein of unknown function (DUF3102)
LAKQLKRSQSLAARGFDYTRLEARAAERAHAAAENIRQMVRRTLEDLVDIGGELLAVKEALGHGRFETWVDAEFGWSPRMARNFMAVATRFGKSAIIADLGIEATAAYLLAAPSTPDSARQAAIDRARAGERITTRVAKEIVGKTKNIKKARTAPGASDLARQLQDTLERCRDRWGPTKLLEFASQLRAFADSLDQPKQLAVGKRRPRKGVGKS